MGFGIPFTANAPFGDIGSGSYTHEEAYGDILPFAETEVAGTGATVAEISDPAVAFDIARRKSKEKSKARKTAASEAAEKERLRPKVKGQEGVIDYTKLQKTLKQMTGIRGKAVSPDILKSLLSGAVKGQIEPAIAREERAMDRAIQQKRLDVQTKQHGEAVAAEERTAEMGFVGDVIGVVAEVTILCTELNRQGLLDIHVIERANKYRRKHITKEVYEGYLIWATPLVEIMKISPLATKIVCSLWKPLTYELASRGNKRKGNLIGKIAYSILAPFSRFVYFLNTQEVSYAKGR